jgi:hypothetical protein
MLSRAKRRALTDSSDTGHSPLMGLMNGPDGLNHPVFLHR